jgi:hypothetical protein
MQVGFWGARIMLRERLVSVAFRGNLDPVVAIAEARMGRAKERPLFSPAVDYEDDTYLWSFQQAELLRRGRFVEADLANIVEELESMGKRERFKLESSYRLILSHLLKWQFQPELRSRSWRVTLTRERTNVRRRESDSPSLAAIAAEIVRDAYPDAVREAMAETDLPKSAFPAECPYGLAELRDPDFYPPPA